MRPKKHLIYIKREQLHTHSKDKKKRKEEEEEERHG